MRRQELLKELNNYLSHRPDRLIYELGPSAWLGHLNFANFIVQELKPGKFVELGTHNGNSFFAFCLALKNLDMSREAIAIDTWKGDEMASFYGEDVFENFIKNLRKADLSFAHYMRATFDEVVSQFRDESIDLLHIDGLHTYAAVKNDFEKWRPKVRCGGIILLHDVCETHANFGAHQLWDEIRGKSEETYVFTHSAGLGVWRKPGGEVLKSGLMNALFEKGDMAMLIDKSLSNSCMANTYEYYFAKEKTEAWNLRKEYEREKRDSDAQIKEFQTQKGNLLKRINSLISEMSLKDARISGYENSRSWKATKPLRAIANLVRRLK